MLRLYAKETAASLLGPLALSLGLHIGGITLVDRFYGEPKTASGPASESPGNILRVTIPRFSASSEIGPASKPQLDISSATDRKLPEGLISLPVPYYFPPEELNKKPRAVAPVMLDYPENAPFVPKNRIVLRLLISEQGLVDRIAVEDSDIPEELQGIAVKAFSHSQFHPGIRNNMPVKSQLLVEITFEADTSLPSPSALLPAR